MNDTGIEWVDKTWNPIFGCCGPGGTKKNPKRCWYCYAEELTHRKLWDCDLCNSFEPHIHPERIYEPLQRKKPTTIFVGSMSDMWGDWVPAEWIEAVLQVIRACPQHMFLALTKNGIRYYDFDLPENLWCGVTVTQAHEKSEAITLLATLRNNAFISMEPMLADIGAALNGLDTMQLPAIRCLIIGPLNKRGHDPVTKREWVERIIEIAGAAGVPVFLKNALYEKGIMPEAEVKQRQVTPWRV